jgi:hypothetical protein
LAGGRWRSEEVLEFEREEELQKVRVVLPEERSLLAIPSCFSFWIKSHPFRVCVGRERSVEFSF